MHLLSLTDHQRLILLRLLVASSQELQYLLGDHNLSFTIPLWKKPQHFDSTLSPSTEQPKEDLVAGYNTTTSSNSFYILNQV